MSYGSVSTTEPDMSNGLEEEELAQKAMGDFGRWQLGIILLLSAIKLPIAWNKLSIVFLAAPVPYHCVNSSQTCLTDQGTPCTTWEYDRSVFTETIITEWDLVCQKHQLVSITQMIFMIGILVGNIIFSTASDRHGRKIPLVACVILQTMTGVWASYTSWFSTFLILRFLQAVATGGAFTIGFVLTMEILSGKMRTTVTTLSQIPFNIGFETMVVIAYFTRDWRLFQLAISLSPALIIPCLWKMPESPRWLLAVGRQEEAVAVLRKAAATNKNQIPAEIIFIKTEKQRIGMEDNKKANILDLLCTPNMRRTTLVMCFNWMACGLCFYGLAQYVSNIGGNIFLNVALSGSLVVPGMLTTLYTLNKFGRKASMLGGQILSALSCFLFIFFPEAPGESNFPHVTLASLGILGMGISFASIMLYSGELYPTVVRNLGVGSGSMSARIGSMIAPFIVSLSEYNQILPPLLFSGSLAIATLLCLLLPETRNTQLPQTLEDGENLGRKLPLHMHSLHGVNTEEDEHDCQN